jgi:hypothetical protein
MDPVANPYQPGAGRRPPELAGRAAIIEDAQILMRRCQEGLGDRGRILHGLRGVGKTVLLNEFYSLAEQAGWIVAKVEGSPARPQIARYIAQGLHRSLREATGRFDTGRLKRALVVFKSFTVKIDPSGSYSFGIDVDAATGHADTGDLTTDLTDLFTELGRAAADLGVGVMLLIDEMQELSKAELVALNLAAHEVGQGAAPLPVVIIGAGLPSLPAILADATTYAERLFEYHSIGALSPQAATDALVRPAAARGVEWTPEALNVALAASGGYPFALQTCGKFIWDYTRTSPIEADDAQTGIRYAREEMDNGIYLSRWNRATPAQRQILRAMAAHPEGAIIPIANIISALGTTHAGVSVPRDQLIKKGLIYAPERGLIAFTVPGMAEFVRRQPE